jgi:hypothetical protein
MRDTCEIHVSARVIKIHAGYIQDLHDEIHVSQMHPERDVSDMKDTCGGYIRDTCEIHVSSEVIKIHAGYMRNACGIHAGHVSRGFGVSKQVGLEIRILMCISMYPICIRHVS